MLSAFRVRRRGVLVGDLRVVLMVSGVVGCGLLEPPEPEPATLVVCGSSTMGARLLPRLAARWVGRRPFPDDRALDKGERWCAQGTPEGQGLVEVCVTYDSSGAAFEALKAGTCDLGMYSGPWAPIAEAHPELDVHEVGMDGIMIATGSADTRLGDAISVERLRALYQGEDVPADLAVLTREEEGSGTSAALRTLLGVEALAGTEGVAADDFGRRIQQTDWWVYHVSAQEELDRSGFRLLKVAPSEGALAEEPSVYNIRSGAYPLVRPLNLLTPKGQPASAFVAWVKSAEARPVFEALFMAHATSAEVGGPRVEVACPGARPSPETVPGARVGTLYFGDGEATELRQDWQLAPVVRSSIEAAQKQGKDLLVVGFSDPLSTEEADCLAAAERAGFVHGVLEAELRYLPEGVDRPGLHETVVGGPTTQWGPAGPDNRVVVIQAIDRPIPPPGGPGGEGP